MARSPGRATHTPPAPPVGLAGTGAPAGHTAATVQVLEWPRWLTTNYLPKIVDGLRADGVTVITPHLLATGSARLQTGDWLHLHWPTESLTHRARWVYLARASAFHHQLRRLKQRGVRIAWTAHNLVPHDDPHPDLGRRFRAELLALVDHVFIHFPGAQATLAAEFGYTGPCTVTHHPHYVDRHPVPPARAAARTELGLPTAAFVALSFGKIRPYKGTADIIEAFRQIAGRDDRLLIAGSPEGDVGETLRTAQQDHRIIVHDRRIPDDEVPTYFAAADTAVISHHAFFTSGSAMLALSMGCPLVGPAVHHLADLAGGQRLVPIGPGVDGLARGLDLARAQSPRVDRQSLRDWAQAHGTWRDATAATAAVFRSPP
ncbi:glycosyltransferase [Mycobacterium sp. MBM]|nr:glycosyltransferase [Mycobacterium sp. MBM]